MEDFAAVIRMAVTVMQFPMEIWGFTVSFWQIGLWSMAASVVVYVIVRIFNG